MKNPRPTFDRTTFSAIMLAALRAFQREDWLLNCLTGADIERKLKPFAMRFIREGCKNAAGNEQKIGEWFFQQFSKKVL